jgi:hypothetical protein
MDDSKLKISQDWFNLITQLTLNYQQHLNNRDDEKQQKITLRDTEPSLLNHSAVEEKALAKA